MMEGGIIERSVSHYSNPLVVVIKKDGGVRLCLDARKINQIIIPDRESPESINEIFQKFSGVRFMTSLDPVSYTHLDVYKRQTHSHKPHV